MARRATRPLLLFSEGVAVYAGIVSDTTPHSHYAVQVCLALDGHLSLTHNGESKSYTAAVVTSAVLHKLQSADSRVLLLYYDPIGLVGEAFGDSYTDIVDVSLAVASYRERALRLFDSDPPAAKVHELRRAIETCLVPQVPVVSARDERIQSIVKLLERETANELNVEQLADSVGLSSGRLRHLFRQQLGIPIRSYRLWQRMRRAVEMIPVGGSLTEVAHQAGFADSAHLSRAFRQLFGMAPSDLFRP